MHLGRAIGGTSFSEPSMCLEHRSNCEMTTHHVSLQEPQVQEHPPDHPDIWIAFQEPASEEWIHCCVNRFSSRVSKHFELSRSGFLVRRVPRDQGPSEMANLRQLVDEVNASVEDALGSDG